MAEKLRINPVKKVLGVEALQVLHSHNGTMPTAVATKNAMNGTKRKGAPSKDTGKKDSKKPKIDSSKKAPAKKVHVKSKPVKKAKAQVDSEDSDSDGGAPLYNKASAGSEDLVESDTTEFSSEGKSTPAAKEGLHPDRVKAAVVNSKNSLNS